MTGTLRRLTVVGAVASLLALSTGARGAISGAESTLVDLTNGARGANGKAPVREYWDLSDDARAHSEAMRSRGEVFHNPDLGSATTGWSALAENVGVGANAEGVFNAFMGSPDNRANILGDYDYVGVGVADDNGKVWVTMIFMHADGPVVIDIGDSVFRDDVLWLTNGGSRFTCNPPFDDMFCPGADVERETMAEFVAKTLLLPPAGRDYFSDDENSPYEDSINRVAAAGIVFGCNPPANDRFCPDRILNRGEMAAFFVRALDLSDAGAGDYFRDDDNSVFRDDIDKVAAAGISYGCNPPQNDMFCPNRTLNRGEISAFLHRGVG